jgi:carnosine N-methyltransferase
MLLICRTCDTMLTFIGNQESKYVCEGCNESYPIVDGIPILIKNPHSYLAKTLLNNENFIRQQNQNINELNNILVSTVNRSDILLKVKNGMIDNLKLTTNQQNALHPFVKKEDILNLIHNTEVPQFYAGTLNYLKKDWCWTVDGEKELEIIFDIVSSYVQKYLKTNSTNALVLGAGAGRTAWDLLKVFKKVYAVDSSFCLVNYFYTLLKENIRFNQITHKNIYSTQEMVIHCEASLNPLGKESLIENQRIDNFHFFIGDATKLFLPSDSMDVISSIYFTDVLPLRIILSEVKRVLKVGGLFIHFGPLSYHYSDPKDCLSAEEIKKILEQNNFTILEESRVVLPHTYTGENMNMNIYNNWSFVAVKNHSIAKSIIENIHLDSVLNIVHNINYDIKGVISESGDYLTNINIDLFNGEKYEGSMFILDIIKLSNNRRVSEIIKDLMEMYKGNALITNENVLGLMNDLCLNGILSVCFSN